MVISYFYTLILNQLLTPFISKIYTACQTNFKIIIHSFNKFQLIVYEL